MENFSCPSGFLIAQDEQGNYVPFFVRVRESEIIWNNGEHNFSEEFLDKLKDMGCTNIIQTPPSPSYSFELDGWNGMIETDGRISAVKEFRFESIEEFFILRDKEDEGETQSTVTTTSSGKKYYSTTVSFPFQLLRKGLFIATTLNTTIAELKTASSNIFLDDKFVNNHSIVDKIGLTLYLDDNPTPIEGEGDVIGRYGEDGVFFRSSISYFNGGIVPNDPFEYDAENGIFYFDNTEEAPEYVENLSSIFVEVRGRLSDMKIFNVDNSKEIPL